jgi:hypothetical protein
MSAPLRVLLVGFALSFLARTASAQVTGGLELSWSAPAGCPEKADVLREIERLLGSDRALTEGLPLRALAEVRAEGQRFRLELRFPSPESELTRYVESDVCGELQGAAALILALSLDPANPRLAAAELPGSVTPGNPTPAPATSAGETAPATTAPPPAAPAEPAAPVAPPPAAAAAEAPSRAQPRFVPPFGGIRPVLDVGTLPSPAFGGKIDFGFRVEPIVLVIEGALFAPQTHTVEGAGGSFLFGALSVLPCWRPDFGRVFVVPCALAEASFVFASGEGVDQPEQPFTWFPRFGLGAELGYALSSRVALAGGVFGLVAPARPRFVVADGVELFTPSTVAVRVSAGLEISF